MAMVIMWVSSHNIVCVMLFIAKAHSHSYLVDSKTTGQVREGRWYSTRRKREHRIKERITLAATITYQLCPNLLCILACVNFLGAHSSRYCYLIFRKKMWDSGKKVICSHSSRYVVKGLGLKSEPCFPPKSKISITDLSKNFSNY